MSDKMIELKVRIRIVKWSLFSLRINDTLFLCKKISKHPLLFSQRQGEYRLKMFGWYFGFSRD